MSVDHLDIQVDLSSVQLRHSRNSAYFKGFEDSPTLSNKSSAWLYISYGMAIIGGIATIAFLVIMGLIWIFQSPFAVDVEGIIDGRRGFNALYHYEVDGVRYDKVEPSNRSSSGWADGNFPEDVVYLSFLPSESRLKFNVEPFDPLLTIAGTLFLLGITLGGVFQLRAYRKANRLANEATHVINGMITSTMLGQNRLKIATYEATSPTTGRTINGTTDIGVLEPVYGAINKGTPVAILYATDDLHSIL